VVGQPPPRLRVQRDRRVAISMSRLLAERDLTFTRERPEGFRHARSAI
jgi:hypothetical protein